MSLDWQQQTTESANSLTDDSLPADALTEDTLTEDILTEEQLQALLDQQAKLEDQAVEWGRSLFRARVEKAMRKGQATTAGAARKVLQDDVERFITALQETVDAQAAKRGVVSLHVRLCRLMDREVEKLKTVLPPAEAKKLPSGVEVVAYITAKTVLDHLADKVLLSEVRMAVAERIIDQVRAYRLRAQAPGLYDYMVKGFRTTHYRHMAGVLRWTANHVKDRDGNLAPVNMDDLDALNDQQRSVLGTQLLHLFMETTGAVTVESRKHVKIVRGKRTYTTEQCLVPTLKTSQWIAARNKAAEGLCPVTLPMIVPPLEWGPGQRGGYRYAMRGKYALVRSGGRQLEAELAQREMLPVYQALNALQNTAFTFNPHVLQLVEEIQQRGGGLCKVPQLAEEPLPPRPQKVWADDAARRADPEWRQWRKAARQVHQANRTRKLSAGPFLRTMQAVRAIQRTGAKRFWFVYNLDFRGRIYPVSAYLSPQGDDLSRGLLQFADGKPLGPDGAFWLALHGINALDKLPGDDRKVATMTLEERVQWVKDNTEAIVRVAEDPFADRWWMQAKEPFVFYAFCHEWRGYQLHGERWVSHLPVNVDGTCNGLQHYAAMYRDPVGAAAVNVSPAARPNDVYRQTMLAVLEKLEQRASSEPLAALWLGSGLVDRDLVKRPSMTFCYGSNLYGFAEQIAQELKGRETWRSEIRHHFDVVDEQGKVREGAGLKRACFYLAKVIHEALEETVTAAVEGMAWLQKTARRVVKSGKRIEWTVPLTGFLVRQYYMKLEKKQIRTALLGGISRAVVRVPTTEVNVTKQANAVAPNMIHSLDAAALQLTVSAAVEAGITHFLTIHDSYGTHAADMTALSRILREQFVRLYEHDVVADLAQQFRQQAPEDVELPEPPAKGDLDLQGVLQSRYFFC